jgi:hypothetical protein
LLLWRPLDPSNSFHGKVAVIRRLAGYANAPTNHSLGSDLVRRGRCGVSRCRTVSHRIRARTRFRAEAQGCGDRTCGMKNPPCAIASASSSRRSLSADPCHDRHHIIVAADLGSRSRQCAAIAEAWVTTGTRLFFRACARWKAPARIPSSRPRTSCRAGYVAACRKRCISGARSQSRRVTYNPS